MITQTTITAPDGYQIDPIALKNNKIEFIPIKRELPQSWEEMGNISGCFIDAESYISKGCIEISCEDGNENVLPTEELAEAMLALCQLLQLRDRYNEGWKANWKSNNYKYIICIYNDDIACDMSLNKQAILSFETSELRDTFINAPKIRELIEIAKPLL